MDYETYNPYDGFIDEIERYDDKEELQKLYDKSIENPYEGSGLNFGTNEDKQAFIRTVYAFALKYDLPYDSLVKYSSGKEYIFHTQFDYFISFSGNMGLFIFLACLVAGCFYQSRELSSKISKLIYTSGVKRSKLIATKYFVSMLIIMAIVFIVDVIMSLLGLPYRNSGAKYCIVFSTDYTLYTLNYFQIVLMTLASHLLSVFCMHTFTYFISVILKNGVIPFAAIMCSSLLLLYAAGSSKAFVMTAMAMNGGFIAFLSQIENYTTDLSNAALYIPILLISIAPALISIPITKKADYSR